MEYVPVYFSIPTRLQKDAEKNQSPYLKLDSYDSKIKKFEFLLPCETIDADIHGDLQVQMFTFLKRFGKDPRHQF